MGKKSHLARAIRMAPCRAAFLNAILVLLLASAADSSAAADRRDLTEPAVAAPNFRFALRYDFLRTDRTETFRSPPATTLTIPHHEGHRASADLVATFPIVGPLGGRIGIRGDIGHRPRSLVGTSRGNNEISGLGARAELFVRDPGLGSLTVGGGWDRLARDGPIDAREWSGFGAASIFFPDLGMGPIDWTLRFDFAHRQVTGVASPADIDADRYTVVGQAGWYASPDVQFIMGGRWERAEEEFSNEDRREGFVKLRWLLPTPVVPVEFALGANVGEAEYKQSPFRADKRLAYGAHAGFIVRFGSGETLLDTVRRYD